MQMLIRSSDMNLLALGQTCANEIRVVFENECDVEILLIVGEVCSRGLGDGRLRRPACTAAKSEMTSSTSRAVPFRKSLNFGGLLTRGMRRGATAAYSRVCWPLWSPARTEAGREE